MAGGVLGVYNHSGCGVTDSEADGNNPTIGLRGTGHSAESSHTGRTTIATSTEASAAASRTASLFRSRCAHGNAVCGVGLLLTGHARFGRGFLLFQAGICRGAGRGSQLTPGIWRLVFWCGTRSEHI